MLDHLDITQRSTGRQRTTDSLHQEARDVQRDKDEGVQVRADAGQGRVEREADVLEGEVDGDADEGWGEDDGDDLRLEGVLVPRVVRQGDAGGVTCSVVVVVSTYIVRR
jgi:hypothetical protein